MAQPEPVDRSLARFVPPHEADTSDIKLRFGERLPAGAVKRAVDALVAVTASLQDSGGRFIAVRPQPGLARAVLTEFLERVLDAEVPGRSEPGTLVISAGILNVAASSQPPGKIETKSERDARIFNAPFQTPPDEAPY